MDESLPADRTGDTWITDAELEAMALAADPHPVLGPDAVPWTGPDEGAPQLLPDWYMPRAMTKGRGRWPMAVAALVIVGFLVIDASGLCITSGFLSWA